MDKQKFIDDINEWIERMYSAEKSDDIVDAYAARVDFVRWLRGQKVPVDLKQDIKAVIDRTWLRENMDAIERGISGVMEKHGMKLFDPRKTVKMSPEQMDRILNGSPQKDIGKTTVTYEIPKLENAISYLGSLVTNNSDVFDKRFDWAVSNFHAFLTNPENHLPKDLVDRLLKKNWLDYGDEQSYVDDLRREYKKYCKEMTMFRGSHDTQKRTLDIRPKIQGAEKQYSIDEDGIIHRDQNVKLDKYALARAMELLRYIPTEVEQKPREDDTDFYKLVGNFKNRNGGKK